VRLEIRDLRLVAAIAEFRTLTRAGQSLHLTQSALSHQLADLEQRVAMPLFQRIGRQMLPTAVGARLIDHARELLGRLDTVERDIAGLVTDQRAELRLATECYTCYHWLPGVLAVYETRHSDVDVRIVPEATADPLTALLDGRIDVCLMSTPLRDRRFSAAALFADELVLVVRQDDPFAKRAFVEPAELQGRRILTYTKAEDNFTYRDILAPAGVSASQIVPLALTEAVIEMVRAGLGVSIFARWAVQPQLQSGELRAVPITRGGVEREWKLVTRAGGPQPRYVADFVDTTRRCFERPPRSTAPFTTLRTAARLSRRAAR
jgi:LysR family transcriptional regulator for metE and metH